MVRPEEIVFLFFVEPPSSHIFTRLIPRAADLIGPAQKHQPGSWGTLHPIWHQAATLDIWGKVTQLDTADWSWFLTGNHPKQHLQWCLPPFSLQGRCGRHSVIYLYLWHHMCCKDCNLLLERKAHLGDPVFFCALPWFLCGLCELGSGFHQLRSQSTAFPGYSSSLTPCPQTLIHSCSRAVMHSLFIASVRLLPPQTTFL